MDTIKNDIWWAVIHASGRVVSTHEMRMSADIMAEQLGDATVERVRVTIDRIKTS